MSIQPISYNGNNVGYQPLDDGIRQSINKGVNPYFEGVNKKNILDLNNEVSFGVSQSLRNKVPENKPVFKEYPAESKQKVFYNNLKGIVGNFFPNHLLKEVSFKNSYDNNIGAELNMFA